MTDTTAGTDRAAPDSLVALVPVNWETSQVDSLANTHPEVWGEDLRRNGDSDAPVARFEVGDATAPVDLQIDDPLPDLPDLKGTAKKPFSTSEATRLEDHSAVWRLTMRHISDDPIDRSHAFARMVTTAVHAGAPGVFFPFCLQLHSPSLVEHLAVDFSKPPSLINLYVNAWNNDDWMITRGLTVFGLPELETPIDSGLNDAYFRLMDVAAGMLVQRDPYPAGARIEIGPRLFRIERGPAGPDDSMVPVCGAFGRMTIRTPD